MSIKSGTPDLESETKDSDQDEEEIEIEIDGEKKKVSSLPNLEEEDLLGKPLIADVKFDKPYKNNEGKMITPLRVKSFSEWTDGQTQTDLVVFIRTLHYLLWGAIKPINSQ